MIKVFYDHQKFSTQRYGGISRYFANLLSAIKIHPEFDYQLGVLASQNHYIQESLRTNHAIPNYFKSPRYASKINQLYCEQLLKANQFDIFHPTYYDTYFLDKLKKPLVITIHDMTYERLPQYFWAEDRLTQNKRLNFERADQIIAISETTKKDLVEYSNIEASMIKVVYHGIDLSIPLRTTEIPNLPEQYLLFVGDRGGYKNFYLFLNAFKELSRKFVDLKVILTGGGKIAVAEMEIINRLKLQDKVKHINVSDEELNYLYKKALVFVYPSLYEGFGLPVLEAYKAECPVILSDTECFREVGSDAAAFFNPSQKDDMIAVIDKVISDSDYRNELKLKGQKRLLDFPLDKSIQETLDVYKTMS